MCQHVCAFVLGAVLVSIALAVRSGSPAPPVQSSQVLPASDVAGPADASRAFPAYVATAALATVPVHDRAGGSVVRRLPSPQPSGAPLTFLVVGSPDGPWLRVQLPVRPNGTTGWVRRSDVTVAGVRYRLDVRRAAHRLDLFDDGRRVASYRVGIGTRDTPTPGGTFFLKELLRPPDPNGLYGPYAYGLSGFSTRLLSFSGGDGVIGIHGTNDPASIGRDSSHGCIRMHNDDIRALVGRLPLGTPVRILP